MVINYYIGFCIFILSFHNGHALPDEYCNYPLNKSDCNHPPTPVFSYYKSGSRCEIEIWKGCPTYNKFDDEFICSHYCIGKLIVPHIPEIPATTEAPHIDPCEKPIITGDCGKPPVEVFTYNPANDECITSIWKGCPTHNKFNDQDTCSTMCVKKVKEIEDLPLEDVKVLNIVLDNVLEEVEVTTTTTTAPETTTVTTTTTDKPLSSGSVEEVIST